MRKEEKAIITEEMTVEKTTKNAVRFAAIPENDLDVPDIASIYIPKVTLKKLGFKEGDKIKLSVEAIG